uniref:Ras and Rab interactor 1 n=1 Tax=Maylandia zebra TaxID=106582 RepID=A0A3P9AUY0_9CICH
MAQQEEPLYDFPEPTQVSERKLRGQGSLKNISVLDRLLLTVPVWLQLSINPATALHILQREPPGTFLVRKSRTSQRNVLCVRLTDDSVPSFVQQFGIREEQGTLSLETSAISFPDLPRLISFYCVSRDVLPFPLELPDAIARASSHKELESISHMGIEFWNSHLNVRGPRETPKPRKFCPITTRSPLELDCGSGLGALCFINPLFLQSQSTLSRRRMFKHSLKVRVSTETSTMLSPPLAPPPPPPLMPKTKGRCKAQKSGQETLELRKGQTAQDSHTQPVTQNDPSGGQPQPSSAIPQIQPGMQEQQMEARQSKEGVKEEEATAQPPAIKEHLPADSDYMKPCPIISFPNCASLSSKPPPLFPKIFQSLSPRDSPSASPSLSPYQSPSVSPKMHISLSPNDSPSLSPSHSPYQSPSLSPKVPYSLSPFISQPFSPLIELASDTYSTPSTPDQLRSDSEAEEKEEAQVIENKDGEYKDQHKKMEKVDLVLQTNAASVNDRESCSTEETAETPD